MAPSSTPSGIKKIDKILDKSYTPMIYIIYLAHILYVVSLIGAIYIDPKYIKLLNVITQTFICLFLLVRFNPLRRVELHQYDNKIIFFSGLLLANNLIATELSNTYFGKMINNIDNKIQSQIPRLLSTSPKK